MTNKPARKAPKSVKLWVVDEDVGIPSEKEIVEICSTRRIAETCKRDVESKFPERKFCIDRFFVPLITKKARK